MTVGEYVEDVFRVATGWLGWPPELALTTPIPQIEMALEGLIEWTRKSSPFGSAEPEPEAPPNVAQKLRAAFTARQDP